MLITISYWRGTMPIVSVSLTDKNLDTLDKLRKALGLAGRSEAIRVCLRSAETEVREREAMQGEIEGVLITIHRQSDGHDFETAKHEYQEIISTQLHSHISNGKCLDMFVIRGSANKVKAMLSGFGKDSDLEYMKFLTS